MPYHDSLDAPPQSGIAPEVPTGLIPIPGATLGAGTALHVDLYIRPDPDGPPVLLRSRNLPITREDVLELHSKLTISTLYIPAADYDRFQHYLHDNLQHVLRDKSRPVTERLQFLGEVARESLRGAMHSTDNGRLLSQVDAVAEPLVKLTGDSKLVFADMYSALRHDLSMFSHAFNVAAYCLLIAQARGMTSREQLRSLATAALLHDIGKLRVPAPVLNKTGDLTPAERRLIDKHPCYGFERLCDRDDMQWPQLMLIYQHHEHLDGSGYPVGVAGDEIHWWARVCAVANAFDAATGAHPHRGALSRGKAIEKLQRLSGRYLDEDLVQCLQQLMTKHD